MTRYNNAVKAKIKTMKWFCQFSNFFISLSPKLFPLLGPWFFFVLTKCSRIHLLEVFRRYIWKFVEKICKMFYSVCTKHKNYNTNPWRQPCAYTLSGHWQWLITAVIVLGEYSSVFKMEASFPFPFLSCSFGKKFKEEYFQQNFYLFTDHQSYDKLSFV